MSPDPPASPDSADRWREAVLTAGLAVFDWDIPAKRIYRSPEMLATWDYPDGPNDALDSARAVVHSDDYPAFRARMTEVEGGAIERATLEIRMRASDGAWRWVRWRARVVRRGEDGRPLRVVGTVSDIDELWKGRDLARESQMRLQGIVDSAMDAIISIDSEQRITLFNRAAERIFGYEAREALGHPLDMLIPARFHVEHHEHVKSFERTGVSSRPMMAQRIVTALRKGGEEFPIDASISQNEIRNQRFFTVILRDVSLRERTRRELARAREDLRELSVASRTAREQENSRISRELHDELGQNLTSLKMDLAWLEANCEPRNTKVMKALSGMRSVLDSTVAATRRISADLRPLMLDDLGLLAALEWLAEETSRRHGFTIDLSVDEASGNLAEPLASHIYRIVQESLTNAGRHAAAQHVRVTLRTIGPEIHLDVRDDGRGLAPVDLQKKGSFGLVGIRERVYILAGSVEIRGDTGLGTEIHVRLPIPAAHEDGT
ncbi:MAG TPA: PAS domain S-box protein [Usitatibacteraceae bacterium]|nr:PAS domain S-box protein [Usitatibacteraceae bacterium]